MYSLNVSKKTPTWMNCLLNVKKEECVVFLLNLKRTIMIIWSYYIPFFPFQTNASTPIKLNRWKSLTPEILFVFWFGINSLCFDLSNYLFETENDTIWCLNHFRKNVVTDETIVILLLKKKWCIICPQIAHKEFKIHHTV